MPNATAVLQTYTPRPYPLVQGGEALFVMDELRRISISLNQLVQQIQAIDARLVAHGI